MVAPRPAAPTDEAADRLDPQLVRIGLVLILGAVLATLDSTIVNVGVGAMAANLHTTLSAVQWVSTGYLLAVALVAPLAGWLIQRFGGKRMWLVSVAVFVATSALSGLAWSAGSLIAFRLLQGLGGGLMQPIGQAIVARIAGPKRIGRLVGIVTMPVSLAPILGPVVGGLVLHAGGWRWLFFLNAPIGLAALILASRMVPADDGERQTTLRPDGLGLALLPPGLAALVYALSQVEDGGLGVPQALVLAAGVALLAGYVTHALRTDHKPLLDLRLFAGRGFTLAGINTFLLGATLYSSMLLLPLYFMHVRGMGAFDAAVMLAPQALGTAVITPLAGKVTDTYGPRAVVLVGILLTLVGTVPFVLSGARPGVLVLAVALFVRGVGFGAMTPPNAAATYTSVQRSQVPAATSARTVLNRIGGSIGTAVLAGILQAGLSHADTAQGVRDAYAHAYTWALVFGALTLIPAAMYPRHAPGKG
jgi:EmrB/QacA subfamily drug resistance transporter